MAFKWMKGTCLRCCCANVRYRCIVVPSRKPPGAYIDDLHYIVPLSSALQRRNTSYETPEDSDNSIRFLESIVASAEETGLSALGMHACQSSLALTLATQRSFKPRSTGASTINIIPSMTLSFGPHSRTWTVDSGIVPVESAVASAEKKGGPTCRIQGTWIERSLQLHFVSDQKTSGRLHLQRPSMAIATPIFLRLWAAHAYLL